MKFNTIKEFHEYLQGAGFTASTADTYAKAVSFLLDGQNIFYIRDMDVSKVMEKLRGIKHKGDYSKYKNAYLKFCEYTDTVLPENVKHELEELHDTKTKKHRNQHVVELEQVKAHIAAMKDEKLKLSYLAMLGTGLRLSELTQLRKEDCVISSDSITLHFVGKGGDLEQVVIERGGDPELFADILAFINNTPAGEKVFYSYSYLEENAGSNGFQCHDLRRAFAKISRKKYRNIQKVKQLMRHKKVKTTKLYLKSKVKI